MGFAYCIAAEVAAAGAVAGVPTLTAGATGVSPEGDAAGAGVASGGAGCLRVPTMRVDWLE